MSKVLIKLISLYQLILSPFMGRACRFHPSCSCYTQEAIHKHGSIKGVLLGAKRILSCHPWHEGGIDPVPENTRFTFFDRNKSSK